MSENIVILNDENFDEEVLKSQTPVIVDFWAPWCGPCRMIAPVLEEIASEQAGKVKIGKYNVDEGQKFAGAYNVRGIPTVLLVKNGEVKETIVGSVPKGKITEALEKILDEE